MYYTQEQLNAMSNDELVLSALNECMTALNPRSPLAARLMAAKSEVEGRIRNAQPGDTGMGKVNERYAVYRVPVDQIEVYGVLDRWKSSGNEGDSAWCCKDVNGDFIMFSSKEEAQYNVDLYNRANAYGLEPREVDFVCSYNYSGQRSGAIQSLMQVRNILSPYSDSKQECEVLDSTIVKLREMSDPEWAEIHFQLLFDRADIMAVRRYFKKPMEKREFIDALRAFVAGSHVPAEDIEGAECLELVSDKVPFLNDDDYRIFRRRVWGDVGDAESSGNAPELAPIAINIVVKNGHVDGVHFEHPRPGDTIDWGVTYLNDTNTKN